MIEIDLRSDTVTRPTDAMRQAMVSAEVGDDVYGEDPTVRQLESRASGICGQEAALFVPSGTMANLIAVCAHTRPGDAMFVGQSAHLYLYEAGGAAAVAGVQAQVVGQGGHFGADELAEALYPIDSHYAHPRLVCLENTHNRSGGRVLAPDRLAELRELCDRRQLVMHLDGARIFNAARALGCKVDALSRCFDSVAFCLSKGLGAPLGSLLCGSHAFIERAHRVRKRLGGGMRQAGIAAAAGLHALEYHVERLDLDHANARRLASGLGGLASVRQVEVPQTNIVLFEVAHAPSFVAEARSMGVGLGAIDATWIRAVTHLDVDATDVQEALSRLEKVGG